MKIRILASVALAVGLTVPTLAQEIVDPQIIEQLDALGKKTDAAMNNGDAAAIAACFTEDGVLVTNTGPIYGREAIEKHFADVFKRIQFSNSISKWDQKSPHVHPLGTAGNETWDCGEWSQTLQGKNFGPIQLKGYWSAIEVREGDTWKLRMDTWNITPASTATGTVTPSPTATPNN
jgi:ketosteroid isomerase-like protein